MKYSREWQCPKCGNVAQWSYIDLVRRGNPVCPVMDCDSDMRLVPVPPPVASDGLAERLHDELIDAAVFEQEPKYHCLLVRVRLTHRHNDGESFATEVTRRLNTAMRTGYCEIVRVFQTNIPEKDFIDKVDVHFVLRRP